MIQNIINNNEEVFGEKLNGVNYIERAGVYGIAIDNEGKVATIKTLTGYFLPGGGIESGETNECVEGLFLKNQAWAVSEALKSKG